MVTDFDDLLGGALASDSAPEPPVGKKRGRPTNEEVAARREAAAASLAHQTELRAAVTGRTKISEEEFLLPVSKNFLARVLNMDPMTVRKRLQGRVKPAAVFGGGGGREVYYFHEALPYLVKPKMDLATYLRTLNPADMPNSVNKTFWEAERIKNRVLIETGEAWHDSDVLEVLGGVFMMFKDRLPLITEGMREAGLTDKQFETLTTFIDQLQNDLHASLVDLPKQRKLTMSRQALIDPGDRPESVQFYGEDDSDDEPAHVLVRN